MTSSPKFYTKDKWLTDYALSCGYLEVNEGYNGDSLYRLSLEKEASVYHVKLFNSDNGRIFWDSFEKLPEARKRFKRALKVYLLTRKLPIMVS